MQEITLTVTEMRSYVLKMHFESCVSLLKKKKKVSTQFNDI